MKNNGWTKFAKYFLDAVGFSDIATRPNDGPSARLRRIATHRVNFRTCKGKSICERAANKATCPDDKNIFPRNRTFVWHSTLPDFVLFDSPHEKCVIGSLKEVRKPIETDRTLYKNKQGKISKCHPDERPYLTFTRFRSFHRDRFKL